MKITDFEIICCLGHGAFSDVYRVRRRSDDFIGALKQINKRLILREQKISAVMAEKEILKLLQHPFIINLVATFQDKDCVYFLMEDAPNFDLAVWIKTFKRLPISWIRFFAAELVFTLFCLHRIGVLHRDIKPNNILIGKDGHIRLTDFGSAKDIYQSPGSFFIPAEAEDVDKDQEKECSSPRPELFPPPSSPLLPSVSQSQHHVKRSKKKSDYNPNIPRPTFCGTPLYVAPEVIQGLPVTLESDLWSLGVTLFHMYCGEAPFARSSEYLVFQAVQCGVFEYPTDIAGSCPALEDLIRHLLRLKPLERIGSKCEYESIFRHQFFEGISWSSITSLPLPFNLETTHKALDGSSISLQRCMSYEGCENVYRVNKNAIIRRLLRSNERVLYCSFVNKKRFLRPSRLRLLIATDLPRLLYLHPETLMLRGQIDITCGVEVNLSGDERCFTLKGAKEYRFDIPLRREVNMDEVHHDFRFLFPKRRVASHSISSLWSKCLVDLLLGTVKGKGADDVRNERKKVRNLLKEWDKKIFRGMFAKKYREFYKSGTREEERMPKESEPEKIDRISQWYKNREGDREGWQELQAIDLEDTESDEQHDSSRVVKKPVTVTDPHPHDDSSSIDIDSSGIPIPLKALPGVFDSPCVTMRGYRRHGSELSSNHSEEQHISASASGTALPKIERSEDTWPGEEDGEKDGDKDDEVWTHSELDERIKELNVAEGITTLGAYKMEPMKQEQEDDHAVTHEEYRMPEDKAMVDDSPKISGDEGLSSNARRQLLFDEKIDDGNDSVE
ncbi:hypothetical protein ADUPG1_014065 [Aduncisulcus paluster]|uniref:non-specific serine/threonine protein kinase n=1 Tax=Aduncisulcus paluster TaxID=2918883 RepID=A0ABQ5KAU6_9EUKA|nr:hypothetical protein ADUPG1_014065 [Aduncisulcus paluster]|eukprot:gnl/Carplike_NY0171/2509_a3373_336.p1 GENE.gnl/Carplike_NY0171/2509_a3373_336~~gnl/Carplike_NY0171/2509_a3373_336.p1  ORF type:complete len:786 (-),score=167.24 gnl/Carplike_NY0171/2509_a3373_336:782-3139(-)